MADQTRQDNLLKIIVEEYVKSASPVGSSFIAQKYFKNLSSATIRNDMAELEERGLISHPHTSAGRIPTSEGYQYYLKNFVNITSNISNKNKSAIDGLKIESDREGIKSLAKKIAEISSEAVLVGFEPTDAYYTGISNLFRQPEFFQQALVQSISDVMDHLDDVMASMFDQIDQEVKVFIGSDNPFGENASVVLIKYKLGDQNGLIGILGPNRMNYAENIGLVRYIQELLSNS
ncbi:MAG TPA: hypothetical protein VJB67_02405 [Patescibacteria group bacterium]|nr:hypothetical protein [Patescibacteria group bacterium]